jgi:hypothetical protein
VAKPLAEAFLRQSRETGSVSPPALSNRTVTADTLQGYFDRNLGRSGGPRRVNA